MNLVSHDIEAYAAKHSSAELKIFKALARETRTKTEWPQMMVGHLEGAFLKFLVQMTGAKRVLEIGTFTGYSALAMASGLPKGGRVITCDIDPKNTQIAKKFWGRSKYGKQITLKLGHGLRTLKKLKGPFDLVFIDADKPNYYNYWNAIIPKVRKGGLLIADNVLWSGRVLNAKDVTAHAIVEFNKRVRKDSRVEVLMLPVRDGMTLAIKK